MRKKASGKGKAGQTGKLAQKSKCSASRAATHKEYGKIEATPMTPRDIELLRQLREDGWSYVALSETFEITPEEAKDFALYKTGNSGWRED